MKKYFNIISSKISFKTKDEIELLFCEIKEELGIDLRLYQNEEFIQKLTNFYDFKKYVIKKIITPVFISFLLYVFGFFFLDLVLYEFFIFGIIGLILFLLSGFFYGFLILFNKIKSDISSIIDYSFEILNQSIIDLKKIDSEKSKNVLELLFKGIIHVVVIPSITEIISKKLLFLSKIVNKIIKSILIDVSEKIKFSKEIKLKSMEKIKDSKILESYQRSINAAKIDVLKIIDDSCDVLKIPFRFWFRVIFIILLLFLLFIN